MIHIAIKEQGQNILSRFIAIANYFRDMVSIDHVSISIRQLLIEISMFLLEIKFLNQPLRLRAVTYQIKSCMQNTRKLWSILKSIMGIKRKFTYVYLRNTL